MLFQRFQRNNLNNYSGWGLNYFRDYIFTQTENE